MKSLRNAGIATTAGIILGVVSFIYVFIRVFAIEGTEDFISEALRSALPIPLILIGLVLGVTILFFVFSGFISLGKKFDNKFFTIASWVVMVISILYLVWNSFFLTARIHFGFEDSMLGLNIAWVSLVIISIIFLGIGMLKLGNNVKHSKTIGVLYILTPISFIIPIGSLLFFIAQIFTAKMFFKTSKKFEQSL